MRPAATAPENLERGIVAQGIVVQGQPASGSAPGAVVQGQPVSQPPAYASSAERPVFAQAVSASPGQQQQQPASVQPVVWVEETVQFTETELYFIQLLQYARTVKILAIIDLVFTVLNALINPIALFLIAGPLCGLYGALKYNLCLATCYAVYSGLKAVVNIIQLGLVISGIYGTPQESYAFAVVIMALSAVVQVWITRIALRFRGFVADLTVDKIEGLHRAEDHAQARRLVVW